MLRRKAMPPDAGNERDRSEAGRAGVLNELPVPCALLDAEGNVEAANQAWSRAIGELTLAVEIGKSFVETVGAGASSSRVAQGIREVLSGKTSAFTYDVASGGKAGARWFRLVATARASGGASVLLVDISDHLQVEHALKESESKFRRMVESVQEYAIFTLDATGRVATWNLGAERIFGYRADEIVGRELAVLYPEDTRAAGRPRECLAHAVRDGRHEDDHWRVRKNGEKFWANTVTTTLRDETGKVRGYSKVIRDLTARRGSELALRDNQARLSGIIESAMDAIITVDERQRIVMFNHAAERIFGVKAEQAIGGPLERFIPERFRAPHTSHIQGFAKTGVTSRAMGRLGTLSGLRADGVEFPIEASISQAVVAGTRFFTVILRDVSERRRLEEQLLQSQKMEGIGRLAGGIAHDFNNLLTVIFGYLGQASSRLESTHPARAALGHALEGAERAATLTRQLLAFARKQIVNPQILSLRDVVTGLEPMLHRLIGDDLTLRVVPAPDTGLVRADAGQIEQVIMNLTVNARDAMPMGGTLTIETMNVMLDEAYCRTRVGATPGEHVVIAMTDTGVGMSPEVMERLFEPFFTTKGPGKGTGLGLATCHGIVRQSDGHIAVYSEPGRGTCVKVFLPRVRTDVSAGGRAAPNGQSPGGNEVVLLVEDNPMVRDLVAQALGDAGYRLLVAENGPAAVRAATDQSKPIDLLVTDVVMPEMSGVQLAEAVSRLHPRVSVIYMSGYTEETIVRHGVEAEGLAFIAKPFTIETMLRKVRSVLDSAKAK
ncbi:two-component system, cell cycle sensor histidine kinase and response regulator CckA [Phycisphaerales bacterium]|nr:two-component system, cell cycle sensor histidine kinase and response regulator CckA [Phycisphaerales bacterium]